MRSGRWTIPPAPRDETERVRRSHERLVDLSLIDLEAIVGGLDAARAWRVRAALADDLARALEEADALVAQLIAEAASDRARGGDQLQLAGQLRRRSAAVARLLEQLR